MPDADHSHAKDLQPMGQALARVLDEFSAAYERLEALCVRREEAVRSADMTALSAAVVSESDIVRQIAEIDQRRAAMVSLFATVFSANPNEELTASQIGRRLESPAGEAVMAASRRLRALIERVQRRNEASRAAVEILASHMRGLLRSAEAKLSHTGAYGRRGSVEAGPRVLSAMDVTT